uniref:(northern house mosquito) hypothetical protein n=1 Tax=Culex pipiens TaxID=7175 RepID=A0A8D8CYG7_CULPI
MSHPRSSWPGGSDRRGQLGTIAGRFKDEFYIEPGRFRLPGANLGRTSGRRQVILVDVTGQQRSKRQKYRYQEDLQQKEAPQEQLDVHLGMLHSGTVAPGIT